MLDFLHSLWCNFCAFGLHACEVAVVILLVVGTVYAIANGCGMIDDRR